MNYQIATSLLCTDQYELYSDYYKWIYHPNTRMKMVTINRTTDVRTAEIIPAEALREQLDAARSLRFTPEELAFIHGQSREYFKRDILGYKRRLADFQLPPYELRQVDGQHVITVDHQDASLWEIPSLYIFSECLFYYRCKMYDLKPEELEAEAERTFIAKVPCIEQLPDNSILEFGTRREASVRLHERLYRLAQELVPNKISATSNPKLAMDTGTAWTGTHSHKLVLLELGLALLQEFSEESVLAANNTFLRNWWALFPYPIRVALTDTFGDIFWETFDPELAREGRGLRWDSGSWRNFIYSARKFYEKIGVNPTDLVSGKEGFFTDGLYPALMVEIYKTAKDYFRSVLFGLGTNFSNDMGRFTPLGFKPISLVMKPVEIDGQKVAKLASNPEKAIGDPELIAFLRKACRYNVADYAAVKPTY